MRSRGIDLAPTGRAGAGVGAGSRGGSTNYKTGDTKRRTDRMIMNWSSFATERSLTQKIRK